MKSAFMLCGLSLAAFLLTALSQVPLADISIASVPSVSPEPVVQSENESLIKSVGESSISSLDSSPVPALLDSLTLSVMEEVTVSFSSSSVPSFVGSGVPSPEQSTNPSDKSTTLPSIFDNLSLDTSDGPSLSDSSTPSALEEETSPFSALSVPSVIESSVPSGMPSAIASEEATTSLPSTVLKGRLSLRPSHSISPDQSEVDSAVPSNNPSVDTNLGLQLEVPFRIIALNKNDFLAFTVDAEDSFGVHCTLRGASGDADLNLQWGADLNKIADCWSLNDASLNEYCEQVNPNDGSLLLILVDALETLVDAVLTCASMDEPTELQLGNLSNPISLSETDSMVFKLDAGDAIGVRCLLRGEDGDADLYLRSGGIPTQDLADCGSYNSDSNENCVVLNPGNGSLLFILVEAIDSFTNAVLTCSSISTTLQLGVPSIPISLSETDSMLFQLDAGDAIGVRCLLRGEDGDADLYLRWGGIPSASLIDCGSYNFDSKENCVVLNPGDGSLLVILVVAFGSFTNAVLTCSATELQLGVPSLPISLSGTDLINIHLDASDAIGVRCLLRGDDGNADLFLRWGGIPLKDLADCESKNSDSNENCVVLNPGDGSLLFILVEAIDSFTNADLTCSSISSTQLQPGVPSIPISLSETDLMVFQMDAGDAIGVRCLLRGEDGDADLVLRWGGIPLKDLADCGSYNSDSNENCVVLNPGDGSLLFILVEAIDSFTNADMTCSSISSTELQLGVPSIPISLSETDSMLFQLDAGDATGVRCLLRGEDGNADLYLRWGDIPNSISADCRGISFDSNEDCEVVNPGDGSTLFVEFDAFEAFTDAVLTCLSTTDAPSFAPSGHKLTTRGAYKVVVLYAIFSSYN